MQTEDCLKVLPGSQDQISSSFLWGRQRCPEHPWFCCLWSVDVGWCQCIPSRGVTHYAHRANGGPGSNEWEKENPSIEKSVNERKRGFVGASFFFFCFDVVSKARERPKGFLRERAENSLGLLQHILCRLASPCTARSRKNV